MGLISLTNIFNALSLLLYYCKGPKFGLLTLTFSTTSGEKVISESHAMDEETLAFSSCEQLLTTPNTRGKFSR